MKYIILLVAFMISGCASDFGQYNIKQNGQIKTILVKETKNGYLTSKNYTFTKNSSIAVRFKNITPELVSDFEARYNLKFQQILIVGDYIYNIDTKENILQLLEQIINEPNVLQAVPLWSKKVTLQ